jgi:hypothetical protein
MPLVAHFSYLILPHRSIAKVFLPPEQLGIDLGEFLQLLLQLTVMFDGASGGLLLGGGLEEELVDLAHGQALGQIIEGTVFIAPVVAMAVGFATAGETLHEGGAQEVRVDFELGKEESLALAQGEGGFGGVMYPCHISGEDKQMTAQVNKKENGGRMRKCSET